MYVQLIPKIEALLYMKQNFKVLGKCPSRLFCDVVSGFSFFNPQTFEWKT